jgi:hypothetical protein
MFGPSMTCSVKSGAALAGASAAGAVLAASAISAAKATRIAPETRALWRRRRCKEIMGLAFAEDQK